MSSLPPSVPENSDPPSGPELPEDLEGDLAGRDLRGRDLRGLDLRGRDLTGVHLEGARLDGADLRDAGLSSANLSGASLVEADLSGADLSGADLTRADLRAGTLDGATLERAVLHDSVLSSASARNSTWGAAEARQGDWTDLDLSGASLHKVRFHDLDLRRAKLEDGRLDDADLIRVRLCESQAEGIQITDCTLEDVEARGTVFKDAAVRFANFDRVDLRETVLDGTFFESVAFKSCDLSPGSAEGARFERCVGLSLRARETLGRAGAQVRLPVLVRAWRRLGSVPGLRLAVGVLLAVAVGLTAQKIASQSGADGPAQGVALDERLRGADEATQREWAVLDASYQNDPDSRPRTLMVMAERLERMGFSDDAEEKLREAVGLARLRDDFSTSEVNGHLVKLLLRTGRYEEARKVALEMLSEATALEEETLARTLLVEALLGAGEELISAQEFDLAFDYARTLIDRSPDPHQQAPGYLLMARARTGQGDRDGALLELSTLTAHFGRYPNEAATLRMETARLLEELGEVSAALSLLQGVARDAPVGDRAAVLMLRAEMLARAGDVMLAVQAYDEVLAQFHELPLVAGQAREARTDALSAGGPDPEAEARQLQALAQEDDPALAVEGELGLARLALRSDNREGAIRRYERVIERFPDRFDLTLPAIRELARLRWTSGETEAAVSLLQEAERAVTEPEQIVVLREDLAKAWQAAGDYDRAEAIVRGTLTEFPEEPSYATRARLHIAGIADQEGRVDQALRLYREVASAEVDPEMTAAALFGEATLQRRIGRADRALPLMDRALEVLPEQATLRGAVAVERAETLVELGRSSPADLEAMLAEARSAGFESLQPIAYAELLVLLAREMANEERHEDALWVFERVAASPGAGEDATLRQASVEGQVAALVALGRNAQADQLLESMDMSKLTTGEAGEDCAARLSLARSRAGTGDVEGAVVDFQEVFSLCRAPRFVVTSLPPVVDLLVDGEQGEAAQAILLALKGEEVPAVARQAATLELGRLGSVEDLDLAMIGPDRALASLARIERGEQLVAQGRLAEAEPLWLAVVEDEAVEPIPRSLALLGLARLELARDKDLAARGYLEEVRVVNAEPWIVEEAERLMEEARGRAP